MSKPEVTKEYYVSITVNSNNCRHAQVFEREKGSNDSWHPTDASYTEKKPGRRLDAFVRRWSN